MGPASSRETSSHDDGRPFGRYIGLADGSDRRVPASVDRSNIDEEHLVLFVMDDRIERGTKLDQVPCIELAAKDRKLDVLSPTAHQSVDTAQAFRVRDVVAHHESLSLSGSKLRICRYFSEYVTPEDAAFTGARAGKRGPSRRRGRRKGEGLVERRGFDGRKGHLMVRHWLARQAGSLGETSWRRTYLQYPP